MIDHAAEAQRILRDLNADLTGANNTPTDAEVSATALLAIAHTLQAIHQAISDGVPPRCLALSRDNAGSDHQCIRGLDHAGPHETERGHRWS